ncbi:MAG: FtsQ-type POTRA domain-containing protein, partial [Chloroflexaceae bacterium]|nr:FtsQ-type POTRA domain-containing protein [Chloroflexaceae bacterium]
RGSQVQPGPRQVLLGWLGSGRLFSLVLFVISVGLLGHLLTSPAFGVWQVDVEGNSLLTDADVLNLTGVHGRPVWFVDTEAVAQHVRQSAYVEQAHVQVSLPDRATITIVERRPEVRWQTGGVQYLVDGSGKVIDSADDQADADTLVIVAQPEMRLQPNDQLDRKTLELARALALRLPTELQLTPAVIGWDAGLGVYIRTATDQTVVFGQPEDLDRKLAIFGSLLADQTTFRYLDLRSADPFYQL